MPRYVLDFGSANGGLTPPVFGWFRDAQTHANLPPPQIYQTGGSSWTYYFDYIFPVPTSPNTASIEYGVTLNGVGLTDTIIQPGGYQPTRFYTDFGRSNGQSIIKPVFNWYQDAVTKVPISPVPFFFANAAPAWNYYFDAVFPANTSAIEWGVTLAGVSLSEVINAPAATQGQGGAMTLLALRNLIRQESDIENDPHIGEAELTVWVNQSRLALYDKLIQSFGDDYFTASAIFATDGQSFQFSLPDGTLYGGAPPFYKGELLEVISGGVAQPNAPITLLPFNFREKNRYIRPFSMLAVPQLFPRYRIMGANPNQPLNPSAPWTGSIFFTPLPSAGMQCRLWYAPKLAPLVGDNDVADDFSGWLELVVIDCAIKALGKQERDASLLVARKTERLADLSAAVSNRNIGDPNSVIKTSDESFGGRMGWPGAGAWGGGWS